MTADSETPRSRYWSAAPYFIVDDVVASAHYYRDTLGFQFTQFWGEPPCFTIVRRNGASIMLSQPEEKGHMRPNSTVDPEQTIWDAYLWIDDADALYAEYQQKGVTITQPICNQPYGCREFTIRDCNGYTLGLGQDLQS
ncbi:MAG TPA: VOC family protein [Acidobacteriaceae bacterium]